jgi:hypothetical protein
MKSWAWREFFASVLESKGLISKVFGNKDLAPKSALKRVWGSFEGRLGGRTSQLPQSDFYFRARWVLSQMILIADDFWRKS